MVAAMQSQQSETGDMTEVYAYAQSVGITPQQVCDALANKSAVIREKLIAWKYLLHSLVDTGYTPWLQGDGVAYIETNIAPITTSYVDIYFTMEEGEDRLYVCGTGKRKTSKIDASYYIFINSRRVCDRWASTSSELNYYPIQPAAGTPVHVYEAVGYGIIDGVEYTIASDSGKKSRYDAPLYIFGVNNGASHLKEYPGKISFVKFSGERYFYGMDHVAVTGHFVPYFDNGTYGMLDLVSGNFYGNAAANGMFSYELWDKNNNVINIEE